MTGTTRTLTCRDLGGPCDLAHAGTTADDIIKAQDRHLKDAVAAGDDTHAAARAEMRGRWRHPRRAMGWYAEVKQRVAALPADG